jgi:hypothetical protein
MNRDLSDWKTCLNPRFRASARRDAFKLPGVTTVRNAIVGARLHCESPSGYRCCFAKFGR